MRRGGGCRRRGSGPGAGSTWRTRSSAGRPASASRCCRCSCGSGSSGTPKVVRVRRDLLRQGRVVAAALRLRPRLRRRRQREDPRRQDDGSVDRRPVDDRPPRGRQVADRAGREGVRDGPVRLADRRGRGRLADGAGDVPAGPPDDRLDRARPGRRAAAQPRRPAVRAVPAGAARHLPGVLHPLRGLVPGRRPRLVPRQAGAAGARPDRRPGVVRPGAGAAVPALAAGQRRLLGAGDRHQVDRALPAGGVRDHGLAVERRRPAVVRRALGDAALDRHRRRPGVRPPRRHRRDRLHRDVDRLAGPRPRVREVAVVHAVHPVHQGTALHLRQGRQAAGEQPRQQRQALADGERARRPRPRRGRPVTALAVLLPPRRLHVPHALPELLDAHLRVQAIGLAAPQPPGRRRRRHRHRAGRPAAATRPRAAPASSRCS